MARTLVIYETRYGSTEEAVKKMSLILGPARYCRTADFKPEYRTQFDFFVLGAGVYNEFIDQRLSDFITANIDWLAEKKVAVFATCLSGIRGLHYVDPLVKMIGKTVVATGMIDGRFRKDQLTSEDFAIMKHFYEMVKMPFEDTDRTSLPKLTEFCLKLKAIKDVDYKKIPEDELRKHIDEYLNSHDVCVLGTGSGEHVRTTPVTYKYRDGFFYIVSEGGNKFANMLANSHVSLSIYNETPSGKFGRAGMQLTGTISLFTPGDAGYRDIFEAAELNFKRLSSLPWIMNGIKVKLSNAEFRWSGFSDLGHGRVQQYNFPV